MQDKFLSKNLSIKAAFETHIEVRMLLSFERYTCFYHLRGTHAAGGGSRYSCIKFQEQSQHWVVASSGLRGLIKDRGVASDSRNVRKEAFGLEF